ncbi:1-acyl-sn-glycerol-3-phosphate acyltransferase [hydrothermal vent metagenome]|uniref:1-acyl-sn-glycerol-3-phosphate acyltransferase n=1 Tax=hydrothermal vent metagenome TaxID=652676 RepID=A0A3B0U310_9ZZZZ
MIRRIFIFIFIIVPFMAVTIPIQWVIIRLHLPGWTVLPRIFHSLGAWFLGLKVTLIGKPETGKATLVVANHISWTDIMAIGSVADVTFVAKDEIAKWPVVGFFSSLQKTIYVPSSRKSAARSAPFEMARRMNDGGAVCLFAEGKSDVGTHVMPFKSGLIAAAQTALIGAGAKYVSIQPVTIAYIKLQGLPITRTERSLIAWIKAKSVVENIRDILHSGTKEVVVAFGKPMPLAEGSNRKAISLRAENEVRRMLVALNRGQKLSEIEI